MTWITVFLQRCRALASKKSSGFPAVGDRRWADIDELPEVRGLESPVFDGHWQSLPDLTGSMDACGSPYQPVLEGVYRTNSHRSVTHKRRLFSPFVAALRAPKSAHPPSAPRDGNGNRHWRACGFCPGASSLESAHPSFFNSLWTEEDKSYIITIVPALACGQADLCGKFQITTKGCRTNGNNADWQRVQSPRFPP